MRRFEYARGESSRYWQVSVDGAAVTIEWGAIGAERLGSSRRRVWASAQVAREEAERLIADRVERGWMEIGASPAGPEEIDLNAYSGLEDLVELYPSMDARVAVGASARLRVTPAPAPVDEDDAPLAALEAHRAECRSIVEHWVESRAPVPRRLLAAVWRDPDWRSTLSEVVAEVSEPEPMSGVISEVEDGRIALLGVDGDVRWAAVPAVVLRDPGGARV